MQDAIPRFTGPAARTADTFAHCIGGARVRSSGHFEVIDPSTGLAFAQAPNADQEQLNMAVRAARNAFPSWSSLSWNERGTYLQRFAAAIDAERDGLAGLLTREQGKPLPDAQAELQRAIDNFRAYSRQQLRPRILRENDRERIEEHYRPCGVAAVISPWNVPVNLFALRAGPLLQSGNTVVAKPSPYTPLTTLRIGELAASIFPPGVLNVIAGRDPLGQWLSEHPDVDRVSFTGSVRTGKLVMAAAAGTLKRVGLELGGNDPAIVLDDVDVEAVAQRLISKALWNCGQVCMAVKRIYVPDGIYEPMVQALGRLARGMKVGNGLEPGTQLGPLQNRMQFDYVRALVEETAATAGVRIVAGGKPLERPGYFIAPTIVGDIDDGARLVREEQFGPVVPVLRYTVLADAVRRANSTRFGLGASVWSSDPRRAASVAAQLEAGTVWVNDHAVLEADIPFGGWKESGIGRGNGELGLQSCMESTVLRVPKLAVAAGTPDPAARSRP